MSNKSYYKGTFDEVHIPEALLGKVIDMDMNKTKKQRTNRLRVALASVAAFALCMIASNGICFAATGETWVSKVIMIVNGKEEEQEVTWHKEGDTVIGELEYELENDDNLSIMVHDQTIIDNENGDAETPDMEVRLYDDDYTNARVVQEEGKVYFSVGENKIDITDDIADGKANGEFTFDGERFAYEITENGDDYDITFYTIGE